LNLIEMKPEMLKQEEDGQPRFFHGSGHELFWVERPGSGQEPDVVRFHLTFLGNYIEGEKGKPLLWGMVVQPEEKGKAAYKGSDIVQRSTQPIPADMVEAAKRFVGSIHQAPAGAKKAILMALAASAEQAGQ
jgi:hypothetical protein